MTSKLHFGYIRQLDFYDLYLLPSTNLNLVGIGSWWTALRDGWHSIFRECLTHWKTTDFDFGQFFHIDELGMGRYNILIEGKIHNFGVKYRVVFGFWLKILPTLSSGNRGFQHWWTGKFSEITGTTPAERESVYRVRKKERGSPSPKVCCLESPGNMEQISSFLDSRSLNLRFPGFRGFSMGFSISDCQFQGQPRWPIVGAQHGWCENLHHIIISYPHHVLNTLNKTWLRSYIISE